jgi:acyl-CoA synthetase (AMP-forming)/AMP-acid ligase II
MNEAEFSRSIGEILMNRLNPTNSRTVDAPSNPCYYIGVVPVMYSVSKTSPNSDLTLLIEALPRILSSDSFYEKFARRLKGNTTKDRTVEAARFALKTHRKGLKRRFDKFSRMTACLALTGCYVRGMNPVSTLSMKMLLNACESLVKDMPPLAEQVRKWKQAELFDSVSNPMLN